MNLKIGRGTWSVKRGERGWWEIHWRGPGHQHIASYPIPKKRIYWPLYPWIFVTSVREVHRSIDYHYG
jgi:hypothetical protein